MPSILCIDPDIRSGQRLKDLLQPAGHSVISVWSYWQGVRELRRHHYVLTVMPASISLPEDGHRLARVLKSRRRCETLVLDRDTASIPGAELFSLADGLLSANSEPQSEPGSEIPPEEKVA